MAWAPLIDTPLIVSFLRSEQITLIDEVSPLYKRFLGMSCAEDINYLAAALQLTLSK